MKWSHFFLCRTSGTQSHGWIPKPGPVSQISATFGDRIHVQWGQSEDEHNIDKRIQMASCQLYPDLCGVSMCFPSSSLSKHFNMAQLWESDGQCIKHRNSFVNFGRCPLKQVFGLLIAFEAPFQSFSVNSRLG